MVWSVRLLDTGIGSASYNMALDEAILMQVSEGFSPPTLRFYRWDKPTISLGYFQRTKREIDLEALARKQFSLVRRMTGGRAVLHDKELTYSIIVPGDHELARASVVESYRMVSMGLQEGFQQLGLQAQVVSLADESMRDKFRSLGSAACFDSPSWYELVVEGRKIAGSAQVRAHGGLLQHGSLLLDLCADDLFDVLVFRSEDHRDLLRKEFDSRAVSVNQLSSQDVSYEEAAEAFRKGMELGLPCKLIPEEVTAKEKEIAIQLQKEKYEADEWNFRR